MHEQPAQRGEQLPLVGAVEHHRAPGDPEVHAERGLVRAVAADVADDDVQGAVGPLDRVVEVAPQQPALPARLVADRDLDTGIGDQWRGEQPALEPGVLLLAGVGVPELTTDPFPADAFHGVAQRPGQGGAVDGVLEQVVLRARPHRLRAQRLVVASGEHDDRRAVAGPQDPLQRVEALGVGQGEIQEHAVDGVERLFGLGDGPDPPQRHRQPAHRLGVGEVLTDEQGVPVVVLDEQHGHRRRGLVHRLRHRHLLCPTRHGAVRLKRYQPNTLDGPGRLLAATTTASGGARPARLRPSGTGRPTAQGSGLAVVLLVRARRPVAAGAVLRRGPRKSPAGRCRRRSRPFDAGAEPQPRRTRRRSPRRSAP